MRFAYIGDHKGMVAFGLPFPVGVAVEVTDPHAIAKLSGNSHWIKCDTEPGQEPEQPAPKRRGRPPKAR